MKSNLRNTSYIGFWNTNSSHDGSYEILVSASDGNLSDSQYVVVNVFRNDTERIIRFNDSLESKAYTFNSTVVSTQYAYLNLSNNSRIWYADLKFTGLPITTYNSSFQETGPLVVEANEINTSNTSRLVDSNWSSFYSAGS